LVRAKKYVIRQIPGLRPNRKEEEERRLAWARRATTAYGFPDDKRRTLTDERPTCQGNPQHKHPEPRSPLSPVQHAERQTRLFGPIHRHRPPASGYIQVAPGSPGGGSVPGGRLFGISQGVFSISHKPLGGTLSLDSFVPLTIFFYTLGAIPLAGKGAMGFRIAATKFAKRAKGKSPVRRLLLTEGFRSVISL